MNPPDRLPLPLYASAVQPEWIDYNGHLNDAYYLVPFSRATDVWMDAIGLDAAYRSRTHCTIYSAEAHLVYLRELRNGDAFDISGLLLGFDEKRMHLILAMHHTQEGYLAATCEWMLIHVDQTTGKSAPMPAAICNRLGPLFLRHADTAPPEQVGRAVSLEWNATAPTEGPP